MSGKTRNGTQRQNPGVKGPRPDLKAMRRKEAEERAAAHLAEGSPRAREKRDPIKGRKK